MEFVESIFLLYILADLTKEILKRTGKKRMEISEQQALIYGVELGIDYNLELDPEDVAEYHRLTGSRCEYAEKMEKYRKYLMKYAKKHEITPWEANQHLLCQQVAKDTYELEEKDLKWFDENL